ncbi:PAQR family membrane homeostasis protein TrhA [Treponema socranskii]|uniref:PAQR family membrane homeostasis protein TrhA n=1 Tax=Treponema socranskii TaxID=53419 RepID=UPI003D8CFD5B
MTREDNAALRAVRRSTLKSINAKKKERIRQIKANYDSDIREINIKYAKDPERLRAKYAADDYAKSERAKRRAERRIAKEERRIELRGKERQLSLGEEIFSAIVQGLGVLVSVAATAVLADRAITHANDALRVLYVSTFVCSTGLMIVMYIMSTLHHALVPESAKEVFDRLAHCFVFLVLGSAYTSFILIFARGVGGWVLFGLVWTTAVVGIVLYAVWGSELKIVNTVFYFVIGWAGLFLMRRFYLEHALRSFAYLIVSGLLYSSGCAFFLLRKIKYMHAAGNVLMLLGTLNLYASLFFSVA